MCTFCAGNCQAHAEVTRGTYRLSPRKSNNAPRDILWTTGAGWETCMAPHRPGYQCKMHHPIIWSHGLIKCCSDKHHIRPFALTVSLTWSIIRSPCFPWKLSPTLDQQFHFTWLACPLSSRSIEQRSMPIWFSPLLYGVCLEVGDYLEGNNHTV